MITVKIDVTKILKEHLFAGKNGAKYLDLVLFENRDGKDQYGNDFVVKQSLPKEARDRGDKAPILGNAKHMESRQSSVPRSNRPAPRQAAQQEDDSFEPPF